MLENIDDIIIHLATEENMICVLLFLLFVIPAMSQCPSGLGCSQQPPGTQRWLRRHPKTLSGCLYLNVFTSNTTTLLLVLVWIHGGDYTEGSANVLMFDSRLVRRQRWKNDVWKALETYWANFAREGSPNAPGWSLYNKSRRLSV